MVISRQISTPAQIFDFFFQFCREFNADSNTFNDVYGLILTKKCVTVIEF